MLLFLSRRHCRATQEPHVSGLQRPRICRYCEYPRLCYHSPCRRAFLREERRRRRRDRRKVGQQRLQCDLEPPDEGLLARLRECVDRIREPFSPEEPLDTHAAETLEQEYNRMDTCIRRIIRVVKMLPFFNEIGKPAQLGLLRVSIILSQLTPTLYWRVASKC